MQARISWAQQCCGDDLMPKTSQILQPRGKIVNLDPSRVKASLFLTDKWGERGGDNLSVFQRIDENNYHLILTKTHTRTWIQRLPGECELINHIYNFREI